MNKHGAYSILGTAYIRDGNLSHVGEALLLACLMNTKGSEPDLEDLRRLMLDPNMD